MSIIVLLTDFGLADPYVGQMKAVIYRNFPQARILDLCHGVQSFNIIQAGFILASSLEFLPQGSVVAAVVDPGVGSERRIVLAQTKSAWILAPDNGLLGQVQDEGRIVMAYRLHGDFPASATFHGRDIFAPLAAALARDDRIPGDFEAMDPQDLVRMELPGPEMSREGLVCRVVHRDCYGNLILDLSASQWTEGLQGRKLRIKDYRLLSAPFYAAIPDGCLGLVPGSQGKLEIAAREESAASLLGLGPGDRIVIVPERQTLNGE